MKNVKEGGQDVHWGALQSCTCRHCPSGCAREGPQSQAGNSLLGLPMHMLSCHTVSIRHSPGSLEDCRERCAVPGCCFVEASQGCILRSKVLVPRRLPLQSDSVAGKETVQESTRRGFVGRGAAAPARAGVADHEYGSVAVRVW